MIERDRAVIDPRTHYFTRKKGSARSRPKPPKFLEP